MRINKAIRNLGIASRRDADLLIQNGEVFVNNSRITDLSYQVSESDVININGKNYKLENIDQDIRLFALNKPLNCITTRKDPQNRETVYDFLPKKYSNLISIGRLDFNTCGLLLFTNSGDFARFLELPSNNFEREYKVRCFGYLDDQKLQKMHNIMKNGLTIDGIKYKNAHLRYISASKAMNKVQNYTFHITITEGKNNEIRRMMNYFDFEVSFLERVRFDGIKLSSTSQRFSEIRIPKSILDKFNK